MEHQDVEKEEQVEERVATKSFVGRAGGAGQASGTRREEAGGGVE